MDLKVILDAIPRVILDELLWKCELCTTSVEVFVVDGEVCLVEI